jgi:hypothetical protein
MKESKIQRKIIDYINTIGYCVKIISANKSGEPDIIACIPNLSGRGIFYAFEVKNVYGGITSDLQLYKIDKINNSGGFAYVVNSLEKVKEIIKYNSEVF